MDAAASPAAGMLAAGGLSEERLLAGRPSFIAIVNDVDQFVGGGVADALDGLEVELAARGARLRRLPIDIPSHTPLLEATVPALSGCLRKQPVGPLDRRRRVHSGIDGTATRSSEMGLDKLAAQITQRIEWTSWLEACREAGVQRGLEFDVLAALAEAQDAFACRSVEDFRTLDGPRRWVRAEPRRSRRKQADRIGHVGRARRRTACVAIPEVIRLLSGPFLI